MAPLELILPSAAAAAILHHCARVAPHEACGLMAGDESGAVRMVYPLDNTDRSPTSYTVDPAGHVGALRHAERMGWDLIGVFHSHPEGRAWPSSTDIGQASYPEWVYVVVGLGNPADPDLRAFSIIEGVVREIPVKSRAV